MQLRTDTIVIGGGAMGSAAAWNLARRGRDVVLLEQFAAGHTMGASHGASRNFNVAYAEPTYVDMLTEALPLWRELEQESGQSLLDLVGVANHGDNPTFNAVHDALGAANIPSEFLAVEDAASRWPGIRFDSRVLYTPQAGRLNADRSVAALQSAARAHGALVLHESRAIRVDVVSDDSVRVRVAGIDGETLIVARRAIVAVGAWTQKLVPGVLITPQLVVTQEQPAHFAVRDDSTDWPGFNHSRGQGFQYDYWRSGVYGMFTPGEGVKAGWHGVGPVVDPDERDFLPEPLQLEALQQYARDWLPGVDADAFVPISCTYTTSPDSNFVIDRVGPVAVAAGFSGHGFKFTPVVGRMLADLVDDAGRAPDLFALDARRSTAATGPAAGL